MLAYRADVGFSALGDDSHSEASLALDGATDLFVGVNKMVHRLFSFARCHALASNR